MSEKLEKLENESFDSNRMRLGMVYAKALLASVGENADATLEELESVIDDVLTEMPQLQAALCSPRIGVEEKERILDKAFGDKMNATLLRFLKVVAANERFDCIREIYAAARSLNNERQGRVEVRVQTAEPIDDPTVDSIRDRLAQSLGREVIVHREVSPEIIGGLVVRVGDTVYDGSVASRLRKTRERTLGSATQTIRNSLERFSE